MKILGAVATSLIAAITFLAPVHAAQLSESSRTTSAAKLSSKLLASQRMTVIQYNTDRHQGSWNLFVSRLQTKQDQGIPAFGMAQEVCRSTFMDTVAQKSGSWTLGFRYRGYNPSQCPGGDTGLGEVVIYNFANAQTPGVTFNPAPYNWPINFSGTYSNFGLSCLETPWYSRTVVACSTHFPLNASSAERQSLTNQVQNIVAQWTSQGKAVVIGGDFNTKPSHIAMNNLYRAAFGGSGSMNEIHQLVCSCRQDDRWPTNRNNNTKVDYIWWSSSHVPQSSANATYTHGGQGEASHHLLINAEANVNMP